MSQRPDRTAPLHTATAAILPFFDYAHLPEPQQAISRQCHDLAILMAQELDGPELTAGLRKLLEAKDCFVRASLPDPATDMGFLS